MDQHHRRLHLCFRQPLGREQPAGDADQTRHRLGPARQDLERQHRALREADHRQPLGLEPLIRQHPVEEGVEIGRGLGEARARLGLGRAVEPGDRKPLPAEGIVAAALGGVGAVEGRARQMRRQRIGEAEQVGAVGTVAMQHDDGGIGPLGAAAFGLQRARHLTPSRSLALR